MSIAEKPIATIQGSRRAAIDGVHLVAHRYEKGVRLDTHMHREAQLVYAAKGTMQVNTPKGRWLVPPDRAVWVPARLGHSIDVLADIDMRTLYFDVPWLAQEERSASLDAEFVVRVSRLLHEAPDRADRELAALELQVEGAELLLCGKRWNLRDAREPRDMIRVEMELLGAPVDKHVVRLEGRVVERPAEPLVQKRDQVRERVRGRLDHGT